MDGIVRAAVRLNQILRTFGVGAFLLHSASLQAQVTSDERPITLPNGGSISIPRSLSTIRFSEDPAASAARRENYERCLRVFLGQDYEPQPAIWQVVNGDSKVYLFGTVHELPEGMAWRSPTLNFVIEQANELWMEGTSDGRPGSANDKKSVSNDLRGLVSGTRRAKLEGMLSMLPESVETTLTKEPIWVIAFTLTRLAQSMQEPKLVAGADEQLASEFKKRGKPVLYLENGNDVTARLSKLSLRQQKKMLEAALDSIGEQRDSNRLMKPYHAWAMGKRAGDGVFDRMPSGLNFLKTSLYVERNHAWAGRVISRLKSPGVTLFAVGASHFDGGSSILVLLEASGYHVTRISYPTTPLPSKPFLPTPVRKSDCPPYLFGDKHPLG